VRILKVKGTKRSQTREKKRRKGSFQNTQHFITHGGGHKRERTSRKKLLKNWVVGGKKIQEKLKRKKRELGGKGLGKIIEFCVGVEKGNKTGGRRRGGLPTTGGVGGG